MPTVKVKQCHDFLPSTLFNELLPAGFRDESPNAIENERTVCRTYAPCASSETGPLGVSQSFGMFQAKKSLSKLLAPL